MANRGRGPSQQCLLIAKTRLPCSSPIQVTGLYFFLGRLKNLSLILPQWQKLEPMKHLDSMSPFAIKFHYSIATALSFVLHAIYLGCLMGVVGWLSYLTTRESLIGHTGWVLPHYAETQIQNQCACTYVTPIT